MNQFQVFFDTTYPSQFITCEDISFQRSKPYPMLNTKKNSSLVYSFILYVNSRPLNKSTTTFKKLTYTIIDSCG